MDEEILIPIVALLMPIVLVPSVMMMRHISRRREWEHRERMRAFELGRPIPGSDAWPALTAISIGAIMPAACFFVAWLANVSHTAGDEVFALAGFVGVAGVIGGSRIGSRLIAARHETLEAPGFAANGKPRLDPDAYDVVSRRG